MDEGRGWTAANNNNNDNIHDQHNLNDHYLVAAQNDTGYLVHVQIHSLDDDSDLFMDFWRPKLLRQAIYDYGIHKMGLSPAVGASHLHYRRHTTTTTTTATKTIQSLSSSPSYQKLDAICLETHHFPDSILGDGKTTTRVRPFLGRATSQPVLDGLRRDCRWILPIDAILILKSPPFSQIIASGLNRTFL